MEKGENAGNQHFHLFPQCFQKAPFGGSSKVRIVWPRVKCTCLTRASPHNSEKKPFKNIVGKGENACCQYFLLFSHLNSFHVKFQFSSLIYFVVCQCLKFGPVIFCGVVNVNLECQNMDLPVFERVDNNLGKEEHCNSNQHFIHFLHYVCYIFSMKNFLCYR